MNARTTAVVLVAACVASMPLARADWKSLLDRAKEAVGEGALSRSQSVLSSDDIAAGLKEALGQGVEKSVSLLGRRDGFLDRPQVKIPLPDSLRSIESAVRALGQGKYADDFIVTMNRAAESAVPEAGAILGDAIREMTIEDARNILHGPDDAATQYFRRVSEKRLYAKFLPVVEDATAANGVTASYKKLSDKAGFAAAILDTDELDVDRYVTNKALDGLFYVVAEEEKRIRTDPVARSTELLKKVFGSGLK